MQTQSILTKKDVVDQLTAHLALRRMVARRRMAAYERLAQQVLGTSGHTFRPRSVPGHMADCMKTAA